MRTPLSPKFFEQAARHAFRFTCPDCVHFTGEVCAHEWPIQDHVSPPVPAALELVTCKEFELA